MANSAQARKRARQATATNARNSSLRSTLRTAVKKVRTAIAAGLNRVTGRDRPLSERQMSRSQQTSANATPIGGASSGTWSASA